MAEKKAGAKKAAGAKKTATSAKKATPAKKKAAGAKKAAPGKKRASSAKKRVEPTHEEIAQRAYEIYEREGGHHEGNWLQAERELRAGK